jgi:photosystem II stability/assembly factor-like uncharacterized protein
MYVTSNGGASWSAAGTGMPASADVFGIAVTADGRLFATDYDSGVYVSSDSGAHWTAASGGLTLASGYWAIAADPADPKTIYVAADANGGGLFRTQDGGALWSAIGEGIAAQWVNAIAVDPTRDTTLYAGVFGFGVYRSTDGGIRWESADRRDLAIVGLLVYPADPSTVFAAVQGPDGIFRSVDGGVTWQASDAGAGGYFRRLAAAGSSGTTLIAGGSSGIFRSTDVGAHWTATTGPTDVYAIAVDPANGSVVWAASSSGLFRSANTGQSWSPIAGLPSGVAVTAIGLDPSDSLRVYAGLTSGEIFESTDGGIHWSSRSAGLPADGADVFGIAVDPRVPGRVFAATVGDGVFRSEDGGAHWSASSDGLVTLWTNGLLLDARRRVLYAAVAGGGVEALSLTSPRGAVIPASAPTPGRVQPPR